MLLIRNSFGVAENSEITIDETTKIEANFDCELAFTELIEQFWTTFDIQW